jgi:aminotransferase
VKKKSSSPINLEELVSSTGKEVPPSGIREFFDIVYKMPDCISLGVGEPDFDTPWRISDSGIYSIKDGYTHYTPNRGLPELRKLVVEYIKKNIGTGYDPDQETIITMGVSQGLDLALRSIINPGDEIIIFEPCYVSYGANISMLHGVPVVVPTYFHENFRISVDRLREAITPRTKAILLNYPSNPTGVSLDKKTLENIAGLAMEHNLLVLSDEIYSAITFGSRHVSITSLPGMKERTIYLNGFSKSHAMTGWRLGFVCAPEYIISIMLKIHQYIALCASSIAQYAAIEAMEHGEKDVLRMRGEYIKRRNFIVNRFNEAGLPCLMPDGAFYVFPDISSTGLTSKEFALKLLNSKKVAVVPGNAFGKAGEKYIRCSYATSMENIRTALQRIEEFVKERSWES